MVKQFYPFSASDVGSDTMTQSEKEALAAEWNANYEANEAVKYKFLRKNEFSKTVNKRQGLEEQLDLLWHDIDGGKFGEDAKTGEWFKAVKKVKDDIPKP